MKIYVSLVIFICVCFLGKVTSQPPHVAGPDVPKVYVRDLNAVFPWNWDENTRQQYYYHNQRNPIGRIITSQPLWNWNNILFG